MVLRSDHVRGTTFSPGPGCAGYQPPRRLQYDLYDYQQGRARLYGVSWQVRDARLCGVFAAAAQAVSKARSF